MLVPYFKLIMDLDLGVWLYGLRTAFREGLSRFGIEGLYGSGPLGSLRSRFVGSNVHVFAGFSVCGWARNGVCKI